MKMEDCTVEENVQIAKDTYKMKIWRLGFQTC